MPVSISLALSLSALSLLREKKKKIGTYPFALLVVDGNIIRGRKKDLFPQKVQPEVVLTEESV